MKPLEIAEVIIKAIILPIISMYFSVKWNPCNYLSFIPVDYLFEAGLTFYLAIFSLIILCIEKYIEAKLTTIVCVFYLDEKNEDSRVRQEVSIGRENMDVVKVGCHLTIDGDYETIKKTEIYLDIPKWFSAQIDDQQYIREEGQKLKWVLSSLMPSNDNGKPLHIDSRSYISFIRNNDAVTSMDLTPTINTKWIVNFMTNGLIVRNKGN